MFKLKGSVQKAKISQVRVFLISQYYKPRAIEVDPTNKTVFHLPVNFDQYLGSFVFVSKIPRTDLLRQSFLKK